LLFNTNSSIFQLYHGENKLTLNKMMMRSTLYHLTETTVRGETCCPTRTQYPDSEPTSLCSFSL